MQLLDWLRKILRNENNPFASYIDRFVLPVGIAALVLLTPFTINNFHQGRTDVGLAILLVQALLLVDVLALRRGAPPPVHYGLLVVPMIIAMLAAVVLQGILGALWGYPIVLICHFVLSRRLALLFSVGILAALTFVIAYWIDPALAARMFASLFLTIAMINIVLNVISELQDAIVQQSERLKLERDRLGERVKELQAFFTLSELTGKEITIEELCQEFSNALPKSWQYPEITCTRIVNGGKEFRTENFVESLWMQSAPIKVHGSAEGRIEVVYLEERPEEYEGPFLKEEGLLINALAERLGHITDRKRMEAEILALSITDQLTGLHNRRGFLSLAEQQLKLSDRNKRGMQLYFADLDGLKWINDTLGHEEGDKALIEAATVLKETFRASDIIARLGGDEYAALAVDILDAKAEIFTARLQSLIDKLNNQENRRYRLSISVGCSYYDPEHPCSIDELMASADKLMYEQKQNKKGTLPQDVSLSNGIH